MSVSFRAVKPPSLWVFALLLHAAFHVHAADDKLDSVPVSDMQAGMAAYDKGDYDAAMVALQKPAGAGDRDALFYLGESVLFNTARVGHLVQAYNVYKLAEAAGDPRARFRLAEMQVTGIPHPQDVNAALASLRRASDSEFTPAHLARTQIFKARTLAREWSSKIDVPPEAVLHQPERAGIDGHQFGIGAQVSCTRARDAALLSRVGNQLYDRFADDLALTYYSKQPDQVVARPLLAPFYAHVIESDKSLFQSCSISLGVPRDAVTTGDRIPSFDLTELAASPEEGAARFWLLPNKVDTVGYRLGVDVGPDYFTAGAGTLYGCPREASDQIVNARAQADVLKQCVALQYGSVAATGRSLKVSKTEPDGSVSAQLLPEVVVFGQFGKMFYLNRVQAAKPE